MNAEELFLAVYFIEVIKKLKENKKHPAVHTYVQRWTPHEVFKSDEMSWKMQRQKSNISVAKVFTAWKLKVWNGWNKKS